MPRKKKCPKCGNLALEINARHAVHEVRMCLGFRELTHVCSLLGATEIEKWAHLEAHFTPGHKAWLGQLHRPRTDGSTAVVHGSRGDYWGKTRKDVEKKLRGAMLHEEQRLMRVVERCEAELDHIQQWRQEK